MPKTNEDNVPLAFALTLAAGLATTIGSSAACFASLRNKRVLAIGLGIAAGVMIYVSFVEILAVKAVDAFTESVGERYANLLAAVSFFSGAVICVLLDMCVHRLGHHHSHDVDDVIVMGDARGMGGVEVVKAAADTQASVSSEDDISIHRGAACCDREQGSVGVGTSSSSHIPIQDGAIVLDVPEEVKEVEAAPCKYSQDELATESIKQSAAKNTPRAHACDGERNHGHDHQNGQQDEDHHRQAHAHSEKDLNRMGVLTALAIGIHNFPEGLATFVATLADPSVGAAIAVAIALHNIPEGVCVAMPIYYATGDRKRAFLWSFISGLTEPLGAVVGYFLLKAIFTDAVYGVVFGLISGMMVYISFKELMPTARSYDPQDRYVTASMFFGMCVMAASLVLFTL